MDDAAEILTIFARWAKSVRDQNMVGIRADHDPDMLMFDVPPPVVLTGLEAYMGTWPRFLEWMSKPITFDFDDVTVTAGQDVAFLTAIGRCAGATEALTFRLTMGLRKHDGRWRIVHEHHSVPATD